MKLIIPITEVQKLNYGGKGNYIKKLSSNSFLIPRTWVLNSEVIQKYLKKYRKEGYDLKHSFNKVLKSSLFNELLKEIIDIKKNNNNLKRLAVRSSHGYEDGQERSFSGLFYTELNLSNPINIVLAIFKCWKASLKLDYASYASMKSFTPTPCSIVIQEFISSDVGGVIFKDNSYIYISANFGLAKSIVDGVIGCDSWIYDFNKKIFIDYETNKDSCVIPVTTRINPLKGDRVTYHSLKDLTVNENNNFSRTIKVNLGQKYCSKKVLNDSQLIQLIDTCENISQKLKTPNYDIEWTFYNNKLFILQCRPLTKKLFFHKKQSLSEGLGLVKGEYIGQPFLVRNEIEAQKFPKGALLVANKLEGSIISAAMKAGGCLVTSKSLLSHSAIIAREIGIPAVGSVNIKNIDLTKKYYINGDLGIYKVVKDGDYKLKHDISNEIKLKEWISSIDQDIIKISKELNGDIQSYIK